MFELEGLGLGAETQYGCGGGTTTSGTGADSKAAGSDNQGLAYSQKHDLSNKK